MFRDLNEQELARHCSEGNREAQDELYRRYAARVLTLCRRYAGSPDDAEDLMQDALLKALDRISTYHYTSDGSLYGWIRRIVINLALNRIRRKRWRMVPLDFRMEESVPDPSDEEVMVIPQERLLECISHLPEVRRMVFNLYCLDGYSHREIGKMLGISEKGSAGILAKARRQLKEEINRYWKDSEL